MKTFLRNAVKKVLRLLPGGFPEKIYATLFRGALGKVANPVIMSLLPGSVRLPEGVLVLNKKDPAVSGATAFGIFEPYETELFRNTVQADDTFVDIGANIGYYTIIAAAKVGESGKVIAFEPAPENFAVLTKTIAANNFSNIRTEKKAVADKDGTLVLNLHESNLGKHSLVKDAQDAKGFNTSIEVETVAIDSYMAANAISRADIIKMDIEGAESLALLGMQKTLEKTRAIFMEFTPQYMKKAGHDPKQVLASLRQFGFKLYNIDERARTKDAILEDDVYIASIPDSECTNILCLKQI